MKLLLHLSLSILFWHLLSGCSRPDDFCFNRQTVEESIVHFRGNEGPDFTEFDKNHGMLGEGMTLWMSGSGHAAFEGNTMIAGADSLSNNGRQVFFDSPGTKSLLVTISDCEYVNSYDSYYYDEAVNRCPCRPEETEHAVWVEVLEPTNITIDSIRVLPGSGFLDGASEVYLRVNDVFDSPALQINSNGYETWASNISLHTVPESQSLQVQFFTVEQTDNPNLVRNRCLVDGERMENWRSGKHVLDGCNIEIYVSR